MPAAMALANLSACGRAALTPHFDYTALDGQQRRSDGLRGQVVLVNFWATTCAICVADMPKLTALHQRFASQRFTTLAVAMSYDPPSRVADFAETRRLPFPVVIDNTGAIAVAFGGVKATPTLFLLDTAGQVAYQLAGKPDPEALARRITQLLPAA